MKITKEQAEQIVQLHNNTTNIEDGEYVIERMLTILDIEHHITKTSEDRWLHIGQPKGTAYTSCHCCGGKVPQGVTMWKLGSWYFCSTNCLVDHADAVKVRATK